MNNRWGSNAPSALVEECICLDISALSRGGYFNHQRPARLWLSWSRPGGAVIKATLEVIMDSDKYGPHIVMQTDGRQEQLIFLESTCPNLGGKRWWFLCLTGKRCRKLYMPDSAPDFQCREALNLTYESQRLAPVWRWQRRARQLRERLEVADKRAPFSKKPKGMWYRTYQKRLRRVAEVEGRARKAINEWMWRHYGAGPLDGVGACRRRAANWVD